jgi:hypothetical protein
MNHEQAICDLYRPGHDRYPDPVSALADGPAPCPAAFVPAVFAGQVPGAVSADALQLEEEHAPEPAFQVVQQLAVAAVEQGEPAEAARHAVPVGVADAEQQVAPVEAALHEVLPVAAVDGALQDVFADAQLQVDVPAVWVPF